MKILVVGGGLVGLSTARALRARFPRAEVTVLEKEAQWGAHQSTHNSGVLHSGLYYTPGSARARLVRRGLALMQQYCATRGVLHEICGKLVIAASEDEVPRLRALLARGQQNGLQGVRWLSSDEARRIEPHARVVAAVLVPEEGIVDFRGVVDALVEDLSREGVALHAGAKVRAIVREANGWRVETDTEQFAADFLVTCAGLHSDRVARMAGASPASRIVPFRGDYFYIKPERQYLVRGLIYPVPDPAFPFLGVHFTRLATGGVECGPNAVLALSREGYRRLAFRPRDAASALTFAGLWRFLARYPDTTLFEIKRSLSTAIFVQSLQRLVPDITEQELLPGPVGVRAQALRPDGTLVDDFDFLESHQALHVLNAPSPAATACLAIGEEIAARVTL